MWERKVDGQRLRSLDFGLGSDWTLHDLVAGSPDPYETLFSERAVALAWAHQAVTSWAQAAADAIALAPDQFVQFTGLTPAVLGERIRRKLKRLGTAQQTGSPTCPWPPCSWRCCWPSSRYSPAEACSPCWSAARRWPPPSPPRSPP
ncbi:hypothetical protein GTZ78_07505 [Streptomyces sp. SID8361]|nr:hypothetical protein [Streptomyces sp. SID8361]